MSLEIYLNLFSQPCRSVYIFAKKNNIQFDHKKISLFDGMKKNCVEFVCVLVTLIFQHSSTFHMKKMFVNIILDGLYIIMK